MEALQQFGISMIQMLQTSSPALDGVMNFFSLFGRVEFYLLVIPFIYWTIDKRLGFRALLILISIDVVGTAFKLLFHQPRPYWIGGVQKLAEELSYGIPSTHSSNSLAVGGYLAYRARKTWFSVVLVIVVFLIGLSRLYLGAHFPHDVLFGWFIGGIVLWITATRSDHVANWARSKTLSAQITTGFLLSVAVFLLGMLIRTVIAGTTDSAAWTSYATEARSISHFFTLAGALFGSIAGYALMRQYARFQIPDNWSQRGLQYFVGIIGVVVIYFGLDIVFSMITPDTTVPGYILRYTRYALATFWMTFGAPWAFLKIKLVELEGVSTGG